MSEYVCVQIWSRGGESEPDFKARLTEFWSNICRNYPDDFERVYAETTSYQKVSGRVGRQYLVEVDAIDWFQGMLGQANLAHDPIDPDDTYSKYEATPPDWFQIEH